MGAFIKLVGDLVGAPSGRCLVGDSVGDLLGGSHDCDPQRLAVGLGWPTGGGT